MRFFCSHLLLIALVLLIAPSLSAQSVLATGPMLGPVEMREAQIWVQTREPSVVRISYSDENAGEAGMRWSLPVETDAELGHTATVRLVEVEPGRKYRYRIELNGELLASEYAFSTPAFYQDRSPPPDFTFAVGGAHYVPEEGFEPPYQILGSGYRIFETIGEMEPAFMLWLGNTAHLRHSDWASRSGYLKRYETARSADSLGPLLAGTPHYATWGASDYGSPSADGAYSFRGEAERAFRAFWPMPVEVPVVDGLATRFRYADVDVFLLDTRSNRDDQPMSREPRQILGERQINWLRRELSRSNATFKVVAASSPILNPADNQSNLSFAEEEHAGLLEMFRDNSISGLVFLSGGKYYGELTRLVHANSYNLYDLTVGALTANPQDNQDELNFFRMPGTSTFERHFALIDISGPEDARALTIRVIGVEGNTLWSRTISREELETPE